MSGQDGSGPALVWCPFPDVDAARAIAGTLLDEGLAACINLVPGMVSLFEWRGERGEESEIGALIKTDRRRMNALIDRLAELHPYDTPAIIGWNADASNEATRLWLGELVDGKGP